MSIEEIRQYPTGNNGWRHWDCKKYGKPINLVHIVHQAGKYGPSVIKALEVGVGYFMRRLEPTYTTTLKDYTIARYWLMVGTYNIQGTIQGGDQLITYLLYISHPDWNVQQKLRSSRKRRQEIGKQLKSFTFMYEGKSYNLFNLLVKESYKHYNTLNNRNLIPLSIKYDGKFKPPVVGYVSEQEAITQATYEEFGYSFDK